MPVQIEFGDKPRTLKYDLAAIRDMEAVLDKPLSDIVGHMIRGGINAIVVALWAGLKSEDKTLNVNLVNKMLTTHLERAKGKGRNELRVLTRAINDAIEETGVWEDDAEGNAQPEPANA